MSVRSLRPVIERARTLGLDVDAILAAAGAAPDVLDDLDRRIPHEVLMAAWGEAVRGSGDDDFGLHAAEAIRSGADDVVEFVVRTSATLGEGLERLVRYHRVLHDEARIEMRVDADARSKSDESAEHEDPGDRGGERNGSDRRAGRGGTERRDGVTSGAVWLTHALPSDVPRVPRHIAEFIIAAWLIAARQATGIDIAPIEVRFRHAAPADTREHQRLFRAPVRFGCDVNGLVLPRALLDLPLVKADSSLAAVLTRHARGGLVGLGGGVNAGSRRAATVSGKMTLVDRVREIVDAELISGAPTAATLARRLDMSRRTLHRQMRAEGTTCREVVETIRRELAERYLRESAIGLAEIAFLLGFPKSSTFHRAFHRWTGVTPATYRRAATASA